MGTVLGLSMTPTTVGLVLVEGDGVDGDIIEHDAFNFHLPTADSAAATAEHVEDALSRTRAMARRHTHSMGVTWTDDAEPAASLLLTSLIDLGFDNIITVRMPEAIEALARGLGQAMEYEQTAVCLIEPDTAIVSLVDTHDGDVQTAATDIHTSGDDLVWWLATVFDQNGWRPECVVLVGPVDDITNIRLPLERDLNVPVIASREGELALARGAALASADYVESTSDGDCDDMGERRSLPYIAAVAAMVVGVLTFVVSLSVAVSLRLTTDGRPAPAAADTQTVAQAPPIAPPVVVSVAPAPEAPLPPPPAEKPVVPLDPAPETPEVVPDETTVSLPEQLPPADPVPPPAAVPPLPAPVMPSLVPPVSSQKPPLLTRILGRIPGLRRIAPLQQAPVVPPPVVLPPP